jgi:hypothetical protein
LDASTDSEIPQSSKKLVESLDQPTVVGLRTDADPEKVGNPIAGKMAHENGLVSKTGGVKPAIARIGSSSG